MLYEELIVEGGAPRRSSPLASRVAAVVGFVGAAVFGLWATPWPEDFSVSVKVEHLAEHGDRYDALFVGSSNVFRSFVPAVIDRRLEELETPLRTFNLGGPGMFSYEADYVLRRTLALDGVDPDIVFMEPEDWDPRPHGAGMAGNAAGAGEEQDRNMLSNRGVFWHDWRQTLAALRGIPPLEEDWRFKLGLAFDHVHAFCWKVSSYGQGPRILDNLLGVPQSQTISMKRVEEGRGFQSFGELPEKQTAARRRLLTEDIPGYAAKIRRMQADNARPLAPDADARVAIPIQKAFIESNGARAIYVMPPAGLERHHAARLAEGGVIELMAYNDPDRYPQFYRPESRFDPNHLDRDAAAEFSRLFSEDLAALLAGENQ